MKKLAALLLGSAMVATSVAGLVACGGGKATRRDDPRAADAYEAYDYNKNFVGAYKTIADAINATVNADLEFTEDEATAAGAVGGYVTKKGGTKHLFENRKGFGAGNSDCFWYYENGTELTAFNCWDATEGVKILQNQKIIAHQTGSMGAVPMQTWNGYGLLDVYGEEIPASTTLPPTWEFSKPMDAGVITFPTRKAGVNGLNYTIDLSNVKITPPYKGMYDGKYIIGEDEEVDEGVYAYFGVYAWQDYYVIATGLACDTRTGDWYTFRGTSRDDSFSDIVYHVDRKEKPVMTSKWHNDKDGGYFTPNVKTVDMQARTVRCYDEQADEEYWEDYIDFTFDGNAKKTHRIVINDETVEGLFPGYQVKAENAIVFIAGLDIKNKVVSKPAVENVDYFNGAKFEGFTVTKAEFYVPTEEECSNLDYSIATIDDEYRGQLHDALMANDEVTLNDKGASALVDYTYLMNYACTSYEAVDGTDVFNFRFDASPVSDNEIGGKLKEYQDKVDSLAKMTVDTVPQYQAAYDEVTAWYGKDEAHTGSTGILQQYRLLLDWTNYLSAKQVYESSIKLTPAGEAVLEKLTKFSLFENYGYKGWTVPDGTADPKGYLWSEAQAFGEVLKEYNALTDPLDKTNVIRRWSGGQTEFDRWSKAYNGIKAYLDNATYTEKSYTLGNIAMNGTVTYNGTDALVKLFELANKIHTTTYVGHSDGKGTIDSDSTACYQDSFHLLFLMKKMEEGNVEIPEIFTDVFFAAITSTERSKNFVLDFDEYIYPVMTQVARIYNLQQQGELVWLDEELANVINTNMQNFTFREGGFNWNTKQSPYDLRNGNTYYEIYFGLPDAANLKANLAYITDIVALYAPEAKLDELGYGYTSQVEAAADPRESASAEAKAVMNAFKPFSIMPKYEYKGWATQDSSDVKGYLYSELQKFKEDVKAKYDALDETKQEEVLRIVNKTSFEAWMALTEAKDITETYAALNSVSVELYANPKDMETKKTYNGQELFDHFLYWAYRIQTGGSFGEYNDPNRTGTGIVDFSGAMYPAPYLCLLYDALKENAEGFVLPAFVETLLTNIKFQSFYDDAWLPIVGTVKVAMHIHDGNFTKISELSEADLKYLNKYWTNSYSSSFLDAQWNGNGNKFEAWIGGVAAVMTEYAGGTIMTEAEKPEPYKAYQYFEIVAELLKNNGYTINANGWGVTDATIEVPVVEDPIETAEDVNTQFARLSDVTDNMSKFTYKGWTTLGADKKGYLFSEITLFKTIFEAYNKLDAGEQAKATVASSANWTAWKTFTEEFDAIGDKLELTVKATDRTEATAQTYTVGEVLGELIVVANTVKAAGIIFDFDKGIAAHTSFRAYYFLYQLEMMGVTVPTAISAKLAELNDDTIKEDVRYIVTIMTVAKALAADPNHVLTAEEVKMVNSNLVGKNVFKNGGFAWAYTSDGAFINDVTAWHGKGYQVYFGISGKFVDFQKQVITYLVEKYGATNLRYNSDSAPEDNMMGIEAAISAPVNA